MQGIIWRVIRKCSMGASQIHRRYLFYFPACWNVLSEASLLRNLPRKIQVRNFFHSEAFGSAHCRPCNACQASIGLAQRSLNYLPVFTSIAGEYLFERFADLLLHSIIQPNIFIQKPQQMLKVDSLSVFVLIETDQC